MCPNENVLDTMEVETPDEKLAVESLNDGNCPSADVISSKVEAMCESEYVSDTTEVETPQERSTLECFGVESGPSNNDHSSKLEPTKESVLDTTEVETPQKRSTLEYLGVESCPSNNGDSSKLESMKESVLDATEMETLTEKLTVDSSNNEISYSNAKNCPKVESECWNECFLDSIEVVNSDKKPALLDDGNCSLNGEKYFEEVSNGSAEFDLHTTRAESPDNKPARESSISDKGSRAELKRPHECIVDATQTDRPSKKPTISSSNDDSSSRVKSRCFNECVMDGNETNPPTNTPEKSSPNDDDSYRVGLKCSHICGLDTTEAENSNNMPAVKSLSDFRVESKCLNECSVKDAEVDTADNKLAKELLNEDSVGVDPTCSNGCAIDATEVETSENTIAKDFSTESSSEISNPNVSSQENVSSSQPVSSEGVEGLSSSGSGDNTSLSSGDSSREIADKKGFCVNDYPAQFKSEFILDGSSSISGIRRIIFKFSKSNNNDNVSSSVRHPSYTKVDDDFSYSKLPEEFNMNYSKMAMLKKGLLEKYPRNVRQLLSTGVLEGVEVKYITQEKVLLRGIIKDCGYLCGCTLCNFSKVLPAVEFEQHAGSKTAHPSNHLFLENGKSLNGIVQELKNRPEGITLEGMIRTLLGPSFNEKSYLEWKDSLKTEDLENNKTDETAKQSHSNDVDFSQSTMSFRCSSQDSGDSLDSASRTMMQKIPAEHKISMAHRISKRSKRVAKKFFRTKSPSSIVGHAKKRDNDLHRLLFMPNGLPDGTELAYYAKGQKVLDGYKQGSGIVCSCCRSEISPSQFETHAGWAAKRQPYRHIYTSEGVSLHDLALSMAKGQQNSTVDSGERCTICGDSGNLILCVACTHVFHAACMDLQHIPEDGWYCTSCKDKTRSNRKVASNLASGSVRPMTRRPIRIVKGPPTETGGCVLCRLPDFILFKFDKRTVIFCNQCEKEYHVECLWNDRYIDLKESPKGKWFCSQDCRTIHTTLDDITLYGAKLLQDSVTDTINRKLIQRGLTPKAGVVLKWQLIRAKSGSHQSLVSGVISLFQDSFEAVVDKSGVNLIPCMVYGLNVGGYEFEGMYCAVLTVKSTVMSAGLLRIFDQEVAELPLVATSKEEQGKGYLQALLSDIESVLRYLKVKKLVLPADEDAKSIWTDKFGFKNMPQDQFDNYRKDFPLVSFDGTVMLEKIISQDPKHGEPVS